MERLEVYLIESWPRPRFSKEDEVFDVLDGLIFTIRDQAERDLFGWRFTVFQEIQGHIFIRRLSDRFKLLQQARDLIRKMYRCTLSQETSEEEKVEIKGFIQTSAHLAARGIVSENWFRQAVDILASLNVTVERDEITGLNRSRGDER